MDLKEYREKKKNFKFKIIFFYSIGRSGTAYLYQVLGHKQWKPRELAYPPQDNIVVAHEKWAMSQKDVAQLKLVKPTSKEGLEIQRKKVEELKRTCMWNDYNTLVITDSCFGRWCPYYIINNYDYMAVYIKRNKDDVIRSWKNRYKSYSKKHGKDKSKELLTTRFKYNYFNITDKYTLLHVDKEEWKNYSLSKKIGWYQDEASAKWVALKQQMHPQKFFETSYEQITTIEGMTELSNFLKLPFSYKLMKVKVNYDDYL